MTGLLLRHATLLEPSIHQDLGLALILSTLTRHKNVNLKRVAMAAMGELLFYICSQQHQKRRRQQRASKATLGGENRQQDWYVPRSVWARLLSCLKDKDDKITRHYACKTLENILLQCLSGPQAAQPSTFEMMLATVEVARSLYLTPKCLDPMKPKIYDCNCKPLNHHNSTFASTGIPTLNVHAT